MKRWTNWPQAWLGFAMNWGFLPAWVSVTGRADWALLLPMILAFPAYVLLRLLFGSTMAHESSSWTLVYDTIYACQDRKDDKKAGVKSTALLFGDHIKSILTVFAAVVVGAFAWMGVQLNLGLPYWVITVGLSITHFAWQLITVDLDHGLDCWTKFRSNGLLGLTIWSGIFACYYQGLTA
jgi:4-hydroxybenzoate polyprenyltransferase